MKNEWPLTQAAKKVISYHVVLFLYQNLLSIHFRINQFITVIEILMVVGGIYETSFTYLQ